MAQPEAAKQASKEKEAITRRSAVAAADAAADTESINKLFEFLRSYEPPHMEGTKDTVQERFRIDLNNPLRDLDTKLCRAYAATDSAEPERPLYALILPKDRPYRSRAITKLKGNSNAHMVQFMGSGVVTLSQPNEQRFALVFERPGGVRLTEFLAKNQSSLSTEFICERIIAPIASAIYFMQSMEIPHGMVNPDNIFINQTAMLGQCIAEPCGYSQPYYYETVERMQALPAGKGEGVHQQDYHALAVTVLYILFGEEPFKKYGSANAMARALLREGTYNALVQTSSMPEMFYDLFRGVFSHNPEDRWNYTHIRSWLDGKRYHALSPPQPMEASRPFEYMGQEANTRLELAHLLAHDWDNIADVLNNNKLSQWIAASLRNKDLAESIIRISRTISELSSRNEAQLNDNLMRVIMLMDPDGPLRIQQMALHIDGLESLFAEQYATKSSQDLQHLIQLIDLNSINEWIEIHRKKPDYVMPASINNSILKQDRLRSYLRTGGLGFGIERILYDLNPDLPCQSPLCSDAYVVTLQDLLKKLDSIAPAVAKDQEPIDTHIAAFIASKINLQQEINLRELSSLPSMASNRTILALFLLSAAQARTDLRLHGLTHWVALRIFPTLEPIHSRTIRQDVKAQILDKVQSGHTQRLAQLIINGNYVKSNQSGFNQAAAAYQANEDKIQNYHRSGTVEQQRTLLGYAMARIGSYIGLLVSIMTVLQRH